MYSKYVPHGRICIRLSPLGLKPGQMCIATVGVGANNWLLGFLFFFTTLPTPTRSRANTQQSVFRLAMGYYENNQLTPCGSSPHVVPQPPSVRYVCVFVCSLTRSLWVTRVVLHERKVNNMYRIWTLEISPVGNGTYKKSKANNSTMPMTTCVSRHRAYQYLPV
jgi:hypothetical protein